MTLRRWLPCFCVAVLGGCSPESVVLDSPDGGVSDDAPRGSDVPRGRDAPVTPTDMPMGVCLDTDHDGLADETEGAPARDTDRDGMPDYMDTDSDNDGFLDLNEANRTYPNYAMMVRFSCGGSGDNCDAQFVGMGDTTPNYIDPDSDNDGLTDREEFMAQTNPCSQDTDGDHVPDLIEVSASSDPRSPTSLPPENSLYVVLPHYPAPTMGPHENREFEFGTRIREADVFFLVDNSASMDPIISALRTGFSRSIVPGIQRQIPDVRMGVGSFDSMPDGLDGSAGSPGDYTLWVRQGISPDVAASQGAFDRMQVVTNDVGRGLFGGDGPEDQTEAAFEVIAGEGSRGHEAEAAARLSVHAANDPRGNGWVPRMDPRMDCGATDANPRYGFGCFAEGRVPILVLASDAPWYDGCVAGSPRSRAGHTCADLVAALNARGGFFIGIDVGAGVGGDTYRNAEIVARMTRTLSGTGAPIVFGPGMAGVAGSADAIINAVTQIAGSTRQDITTRVVADPMAMFLPGGRTTAEFIKAVTALRGNPEAPAGYDRHDASTFYNVSPSTRVTFNVDFYNDFVPGASVARLFRATIEVLGRGGTVVDTRPVFIVVPAEGAGPPPPA